MHLEHFFGRLEVQKYRSYDNVSLKIAIVALKPTTCIIKLYGNIGEWGPNRWMTCACD